MIKSVDIIEFLELAKEFQIIDARSRNEFLQGHISSANNIPILSDEERKVVGTMYKKYGRKTAIFKGLELSGPNLSSRLKEAVKLVGEGKVLVHCWRGGMRSEFFSFLLKFYGLEPIILNGGYKSYRGLVHETISKPYKYIVLCGKTGSGKTIILNELKKIGEQVIDLEGLANHRGSAFGGLGMTASQSQEQIENDLFTVIQKLDQTKPVWIENENRTIGEKVIPEGLWNQMAHGYKINVERNFDERLNQIMLDYGSFNPKELKLSMEKIGKRLGPQHLKKALELIDEEKISEAFEIALSYYDKTYEYSLSKMEVKPKILIDNKGLSNLEIAIALQKSLKK